ncbi:unnamed protein product [Rotaria sp. Silwood1]|nr:unnamed protein product [Rotaria sp. Silwood1]
MIHDFRLVHSIYILEEKDKASTINWKNNYRKVKAIIADIMSLGEYLNNDVLRKYEYDMLLDASLNTIPADVPLISTAEHIDKQEASFMYAQLLKTIIFESSYSDIDKKDLIDFCRAQYADNPRQLELVDELERDYLTVHSAIWWYTLDGFLYKMLNKALRTLDVDTLFHLRVYIKDLHRQLVILHKEKVLADKRIYYERLGINEERIYQLLGTHDSDKLYEIWAPTPEVVKLTKKTMESFVKQQLHHPPDSSSQRLMNKFTLYRGQQMPTSTFENLIDNSGSLLSINSFLSTSANRNLAVMFAGESDDDAQLTAVLFSIEIDVNERNNHPYANISEISAFGETENEILFSIGTVFRIGRAERVSNKLWCIHLTLTIDNDPKLNQLTRHMEQTIQNMNPLCKFGKLTVLLGQYSTGEQFYKNALNLPLDEIQQASIHYELGSVHVELGNIDAALDHYQQSLEIERTFAGSDDDPRLAKLYGSIARAYYRKTRLNEAQEYFTRALNILMAVSANPDHYCVASFLDDIGIILHDEGQLEESTKCHEAALGIHVAALPPTHPSIATSMNHCARLYHATGQYDQALSLYARVIEMQRLTLPSIHPSMAIVLNDMAQTLYTLERYTEALTNSTQAVNIDMQTLGPEHVQTKEHQQILEIIYSRHQLAC